MVPVKVKIDSFLDKCSALGGLLFNKGDNGDKKDDELVILMGGFARVATEEKLLLTIARNGKKPAFIGSYRILLD